MEESQCNLSLNNLTPRFVRFNTFYVSCLLVRYDVSFISVVSLNMAKVNQTFMTCISVMILLCNFDEKCVDAIVVVCVQ